MNSNVNFSLRLKAEKGQLDDMHLLLSLKRSLQLYTPKQLKVIQAISDYKLQLQIMNFPVKGVTINEANLISTVLETNSDGQKKIVKKIVCPFCFNSLAPQRRQATKRWDVTNFNRHLTKTHRDCNKILNCYIKKLPE